MTARRDAANQAAALEHPSQMVIARVCTKAARVSRKLLNQLARARDVAHAGHLGVQQFVDVALHVPFVGIGIVGVAMHVHGAAHVGDQMRDAAELHVPRRASSGAMLAQRAPKKLLGFHARSRPDQRQETARQRRLVKVRERPVLENRVEHGDVPHVFAQRTEHQRITIARDILVAERPQRELDDDV